MGFSDLAAQVILIFIFIIIFASMFSSYRSYVSQTSSDIDYIYHTLDSRLQTDVEITQIKYSNGTNELIITSKNTGATTLDTELIDVFIDGERISRETLDIDIFNQTTDPIYWNPSEALNITLTKLITGRTLVQVSNQYGTSAYGQVMGE